MDLSPQLYHWLPWRFGHSNFELKFVVDILKQQIRVHYQNPSK